MKRRTLSTFLIIPIISGCQLNYNSPHLQSARDDNYGTEPGQNIQSDDKTSGTTFSKAGSGDDIIPNLAFKKGITVLHLSYEGSSSFAVTLFDSSGNKIETLLQKEQNYEGQVLAHVPKDADNYVLEIKAIGKWKISFSEVN